MESMPFTDPIGLLRSTSVFFITAHMMAPIAPSALPKKNDKDLWGLPYSSQYNEYTSSTYKISPSRLQDVNIAQTMINFVQNFKENAISLDPEIKAILNEHFLDMF